MQRMPVGIAFAAVLLLSVPIARAAPDGFDKVLHRLGAQQRSARSPSERKLLRKAMTEVMVRKVGLQEGRLLVPERREEPLQTRLNLWKVKKHGDALMQALTGNKPGPLPEVSPLRIEKLPAASYQALQAGIAEALQGAGSIEVTRGALGASSPRQARLASRGAPIPLNLILTPKGARAGERGQDMERPRVVLDKARLSGDLGLALEDPVKGTYFHTTVSPMSKKTGFFHQTWNPGR
jgi:hypothetical protein